MERKFRVSSIKAKEIVMRALEQERKCKIALILSRSFFFFFLVMLLKKGQHKLLRGRENKYDRLAPSAENKYDSG